MKISSHLRLSLVGGLVVALLLVILAFVLQPDDSQRTVTSTRSGAFEYRRGGPRYSSLSTLDGRAVPCVASLLGTQYNCQIATSGAVVSIDFAEVPTALGLAEMAVAARQDGRVIYALNGRQLRDRWFSASVHDAIFYGVVASMLVYLGSIIKEHFSRGK